MSEKDGGNMKSKHTRTGFGTRGNAKHAAVIAALLRREE